MERKESTDGLVYVPPVPLEPSVVHRRKSRDEHACRRNDMCCWVV
jgi:hypothetical protein